MLLVFYIVFVCWGYEAHNLKNSRTATNCNNPTNNEGYNLSK